MIDLDQEKLDVSVKTRSNTFDWRGQFTPELIEYLIEKFGTGDCIIADPFSGSGTVLLEATRKGYQCAGFEINPSAYYMSKFYEYSVLTRSEREELINRIKDVLYNGIRNMSPMHFVFEKEKGDYRSCYKNLLEFAIYCHRNASLELYPFVLNVLFLCEKDKKLTVRDSVLKNTDLLCGKLLELPQSSNKVTAHWEDSRNISQYYKEKIDLIITSPPYINVFNYHQNYRGIVECFGYNLLQVANSEIGSNRKNRQNRFRTVLQYAIDMGHVLESCSDSLCNGGKMIWIVGRSSNVRKVTFYNSAIIQDLINVIDGLTLECVYSRKFGNRYGEEIVEDILIVSKKKKRNQTSNVDRFREVGISHLKRAKKMIKDDSVSDLESLLKESENVLESPILNYI